MGSADGARPQTAGRVRLPRLALAYFVFSGALLIWPLHSALGNYIHPRVLGLPWSFAYVLGVVLANFVVLALLYRFRCLDDVEASDPSEHG